MNIQSRAGRIAAGAAAFVLWLVTVGLGLEDLRLIQLSYMLIYGYFGGSMRDAERQSVWLVLVLALALLAFVIGSAEYHRKRVGRPESWRLFGWTIAAELSILAFYYFVL